MDFELSEEQKILKKTARDFLKKECPKELVRGLEETETGHSPELWRKMAELGWMGLIVPEEYGGSGFSFMDLVILLEEMGCNICPGPFFSTVILGALPLMTAGSPDQQAAYLPGIASGETIWTLALTEPAGRYDASGIRLRAVQEGDEYLLSGTKLFVPDAHLAQYIICAARTTDSPEPEEGLTLFIVDAQAPGLSLTPLKTLARDRQFDVLFNRVRVPKASVLGKVDKGWPVLKDILDKAAVAKCAEMLGGSQAVLDLAVQYSKERTQFERPIGSFQAVQHHLANMWMDIFAVGHLTYKAAWMIDQGRPAGQEAAMAKAKAGEAYRRITILGHQIFGGIGFTMEHDMHLYHRRSAAEDLAFGPSGFQLEQTAQGLGL